MSSEKHHQERIALAADVDEIVRLHTEWWESNVGFDIERMRKVFPAPGQEYLMFNLTGHPYFGIDQKVALWEHYRGVLEQPGGLEMKIMRVEVRGDTAWLAAEGKIDWNPIEDIDWTEDGVSSPYLRCTEIYHRDDSAGNPLWKMWHTHISELPPLDQKRPAFWDTTESRGLGWVPWEPLPTRVMSS